MPSSSLGRTIKMSSWGSHLSSNHKPVPHLRRFAFFLSRVPSAPALGYSVSRLWRCFVSSQPELFSHELPIIFLKVPLKDRNSTTKTWECRNKKKDRAWRNPE